MPVDAVVVGERDGRGSATPNELMTVLRAVPAELPGMRARLRAWLNGLGWSVPEAEDVELAVSEAVSNVIDHAYQPDAPGLATVHGWLADDPHTNGRRVIVAVIDRGRWAAHQPASPLTSVRGHGLLVMSACMDQVHIQRSAAGTPVILVSPAIPSTAPAGSPASPSADGVAGGARRIA